MEAVARRERSTRWVNLTAAVATVLVVGAVAAMLLRGRPLEVLFVRWFFHVGPVGLAFTWLGWAILRRWPRHGLGVVFLVSGLIAAVQLAALSFADARFIAGGVGYEAALRFTPADLPLSVSVPAFMGSWLWLVVATMSLVLILLLFPDGRLPSPRWWPVVGLAAVGTLLLIAGYVVWNWPTSTQERVVSDQPFGVSLVSAGWVVTVVALGATITSLGVRLRHADVEQRRQLRPVVVSGALLGIVTVVLFPWQDVWIPAVLVAVAVFLVSYTFSVLRLRLHDIDVAISRTVVASVLAALVMAVYLVVVVGVGNLIGRAGEHPMLPLIAVGLVAVLFEPARRRVRRVVDRVLYGRDADAFELLSELADELRAAGGVVPVAEHVAALLVRGTGADGARILLADADRPRLLAATGDTGADGDRPLLCVPVVHDGDQLGEVQLFGRSVADLAPDAQGLLDNVAGTLGTVLRNALLAEELRAQVDELRRSRQRLVEAQDTARRDLERDLHDGAQARLVALRLQLGLAAAEAQALPDAPGAGRLRELLQGLGDEVDTTIRSLRELSHGLHPPVLDSDGIPAALRSATRSLPVTVEVDAVGIGRFDRSAEAAVYFACLEAINNAATHGAADRVRTALTNGDGHLRFEVEDDGVGFDPTEVARGRGLTNLTDRVGALGGELTVDAAPGCGTRIVGVLPVQPLVSER